MILPVLAAAGADLWRDARIPRPYAGFDGPALVAEQHTAECPDGRHLWDLLQTTGDYRYREDDDTVEGELAIRLVGTCVRCGVIWRMEGLSFETYRSSGGPGRVNAEPLRSGGLRAQEVDRSVWFGDVPRSIYTVHGGTDPAVIGWMGWGRTRRGREFYAGRLTAWAQEQTVEAPSATACLRKLARGAEGGGDRG
jgi:hypothetical protein